MAGIRGIFIRTPFGAELLTADGALDRALLAERVFNDPDARGTLEAIMLPQVAQTAAQRMEAAVPGGVAVYDVPLLVEEGMEDLFDCVMVVETPRALRLARLQRRGLTREDAESRIVISAASLISAFSYSLQISFISIFFIFVCFN